MTIDNHIDSWVSSRASIRASRTRLGMVGYAHLAAMLRETPATAAALQQRAGLGHMAAYRVVMSLHQLRRAHVCGWLEKPHCPLLPVFAWGPGRDAAPPKLRANGRQVENINLPKMRLCGGLIAFEHLLRAIEVASSRVEICEATGLDGSTVQAALDAMVSLQLAHVPIWMHRDHGGAPLPQYELGPGVNVPAPRLRRRERLDLLASRQQRSRAFEPLARAMGVAGQAGDFGE